MSSYNVSMEDAALDQLAILLSILFFIINSFLHDIVRRNFVLIALKSLRFNRYHL